MKSDMSISAVLTEVQQRNRMKRDFISPAQHIHMLEDGQTMVMDNGSDSMPFRMTDLCHKQVGSAMGIPARYYDEMAEKKPGLLAENVNAWLGDKNQSYMVRSYDYGPDGMQARAFLSDRYRRLDNLDVAEATLPLFAGKEGFEIVSAAVTERKFYLKVVNHRLEMDVVPGDIVQAGVVISNSEVGLGSVSVQPLVYRLVCTNGMTVNDYGERRTHVGRAARAMEDSFHIYSDEAMIAEDKAFMLKLRDVTLAAIEETRFAMVVGKLRESVGVPITGRIQDVIELTGKTFGINQTEQDSILNYLIQGGDLTKYGLSNAITRASQDIESYDRATEFENLGWTVATMPAEQWKAINA